MDEVNAVVKELVCGIATTDTEAGIRYYAHPDYNNKHNAFVVKNEHGNMFEVVINKMC